MRWDRLYKVREWFPMGGHPYRLFDSATCVGLIALLWYVFTTSSLISQGAVGETVLSVASVRFWGICMFLGSVFALFTVWLASSRQKLGAMDLGYGVMLFITASWSSVLFVGGLGGFFLQDVSWDDTGKTLGSALWFAYATSNMAAALMRGKAPAVVKWEEPK